MKSLKFNIWNGKRYFVWNKEINYCEIKT